jgi:hypothetical protein
MEYARTTSTIGARHKGHLPPPRINSLAHFEHVHMCPHLREIDIWRKKQLENHR